MELYSAIIFVILSERWSNHMSISIGWTLRFFEKLSSFEVSCGSQPNIHEFFPHIFSEELLGSLRFIMKTVFAILLMKSSTLSHTISLPIRVLEHWSTALTNIGHSCPVPRSKRTQMFWYFFLNKSEKRSNDSITASFKNSTTFQTTLSTSWKQAIIVPIKLNFS